MHQLSPSLFIGSSSEQLVWAQALQNALSFDCEPQVWTDGIFEEGSTATALSSLIAATETFDFAAFVFSGDDKITRRGREGLAPRDNVILELGLFVGALGPERVFVFRPRDQDLVTPSDWWGISDCQYSTTVQNLHSSMSTAAGALRTRMQKLGVRRGAGGPHAPAPKVDHADELRNDLSAVVKAATSQGWTVHTWDGTVFRLQSGKDGYKISLTLSDDPKADRERLRAKTIPELRRLGFPLSLRVQAPLDADLTTWRPESVSKSEIKVARKSRSAPTKRATHKSTKAKGRPTPDGASRAPASDGSNGGSSKKPKGEPQRV